MLTISITYALAVNWLFMFPVWSRVTKSKRVKNPKYNNPWRYPKDYIVNSFVRSEETEPEYYIRIAKAKGYDTLVPEYIERNPMYRKPFTCIYCMSFWVALIGSVLIPLLFGTSPLWLVPFAASAAATMLQKWFNQLPTTLSK